MPAERIEPGIEPVRLNRRWLLWNFNGENSPFDLLTTVCLVETAKCLFILDTHTGPLSVGKVNEYMDRYCAAGKSRYGFNSHSDWDHVWGNCAMRVDALIAHSKCRKFMADDALWQSSLREWGPCRNGSIERRLPDLLFDEKLYFVDEGITFFATPGHTEDSASCYDNKTGTLFVGDNIETPVPYLQYPGIDEYLASLSIYRELNPKHIVTSHSGVVDIKEVDRVIQYLERLTDSERISFSDPEIQRRHIMNLRCLEAAKN